MVLLISDIHKHRNLYVGDILSAVSSLLNEYDVLHETVDPMYRYIGQLLIDVYRDVLAMILEEASVRKRNNVLELKIFKVLLHGLP